MRSYRPPSAGLGALALAVTLLSACAPAPELDSQPLVDLLHQPEILVEQRVLDFLPSQGPTRFVSGWWGWRDVDGLRMVAYRQPARIEVANLESRPRTLRFVTKVHELPEAGAVQVQVGGELVGELPLDPTQVVLPALPLGRVPVDFIWPEGSQVGIDHAEFVEALPAGRVEIADALIEQSGYSAVDFVRHLPAGSRLTGEFSPPADAREEQSFHLLIERQGEPPEEAFTWPAPRWQRGSTIDLSLTDEDGLVRIRLLARGTGSPGTWNGLQVATPVQPQVQPVVLPAPPKLILVYVMDALRADAVGHLGGGATPTLDRLAAEGVTFLDHQTLAPNTLPSTKTLFTGRPVLESNRKRLSREGPPLLAELFATAGYTTALLSGNGYVSDFYGITRGFEHLDKSVLYEFHPKTDYNDNAEWVHHAGLDWLNGLAEDERGFLYLHTVHPHSPYDPPAEYLPAGFTAIDSTFSADSETLVSLRSGELTASAGDRQRLESLYQGGLAYGDAEFGQLLDAVLARYQPGEVLVIATSDHGEEFFDHEGVLHGFTLYRDQLHVPLIAWWPGTLEPKRIESPTDTQDLYVTLRQLVSDYEPQPLGGDSLWPALLGSPAGSSAGDVRFAAAPGVKGGIFAAHSTTRKLVWAPRVDSQWGMGDGHGKSHEAEYVFDLVADPEERVNLAGEPNLETDWLRSRLLAWVDLARALQPGSEDAVLDDAMERNLKALGYVN